MKVFNGRSATEEYMSTHTLTFSTPEMTLKKFVIWLGEQVNNPGTKEQAPRLMLYIEEKGGGRGKELSDLMPDTDDTFKPSGAVTEMYGGITSQMTSSKMTGEIPEPDTDTKFCIECGFKIKADSKFCRNCGSQQE
jgi:ribosomal protein L40E